MGGRRPFKDLRDQVDAEPARRARIDATKRAMREALALADLRASREITQTSLAEALGVSQPNVSRIEHEDDVYLSTLRSYVEGLGGRIEIRAVFEDGVVEIGTEHGRT